VSALVALPGVGRKTAERLLIEMRDKLGDLLTRPGALAGAEEGDGEPPAADFATDAESALIALGYRPQEASRMVAAVNDESVAGSEELIRRALKSALKT